MSQPLPSLIEVLTQVPDFRGRQGKRHPLSAILTMAVAATLCGSRGYGAIAEWGRLHGHPLAKALGFTRQKTPCAATLHTIFRHLDRKALEEKLGKWAQQCLAALPPRPGTLEAMAIDGKTLRGSLKQGALEVHLLSVLSHRLGLTLAQRAVADKESEVTAVQEVLSGLLLEGRVVTVDALLCQREIAQTIVNKGGTM